MHSNLTQVFKVYQQAKHGRSFIVNICWTPLCSPRMLYVLLYIEPLGAQKAKMDVNGQEQERTGMTGTNGRFHRILCQQF